MQPKRGSLSDLLLSFSLATLGDVGVGSPRFYGDQALPDGESGKPSPSRLSIGIHHIGCFQTSTVQHLAFKTRQPDHSLVEELNYRQLVWLLRGCRSFLLPVPIKIATDARRINDYGLFSTKRVSSSTFDEEELRQSSCRVGELSSKRTRSSP